MFFGYFTTPEGTLVYLPPHSREPVAQHFSIIEVATGKINSFTTSKERIKACSQFQVLKPSQALLLGLSNNAAYLNTLNALPFAVYLGESALPALWLCAYQKSAAPLESICGYTQFKAVKDNPASVALHPETLQINNIYPSAKPGCILVEFTGYFRVPGDDDRDLSTYQADIPEELLLLNSKLIWEATEDLSNKNFYKITSKELSNWSVNELHTGWLQIQIFYEETISVAQAKCASVALLRNKIPNSLEP